MRVADMRVGRAAGALGRQSQGAADMRAGRHAWALIRCGVRGGGLERFGTGQETRSRQDSGQQKTAGRVSPHRLDHRP